MGKYIRLTENYKEAILWQEKKYRVMLITLSAKLEDGSRKSIDEAEICTCPDQGTANLILHLLRENSYKAICNDKTAKDNESMRFLSIK